MYMKGGPLRWVRKGVTIAEISDWKTLRTRIIEARRRRPKEIPPGIWLRRSTVLWWGKKFPIRGNFEMRYTGPNKQQLMRSLHRK